MKQKDVIRKKQLALVVSAACLAMGSASAQVTDITVSGTTTTSQVNLGSGQSIIVDQSGAVRPYSNTDVGVNVNAGVAAGSITNSGTIEGYVGAINVNGTVTGISNSSGGIINGGTIYYSGYLNTDANGITVSGGTVTGDISNGSGGIISGGHVGLGIFDSTVNGSILNSGSITEAYSYYGGSLGGGVIVDNSAIGGDFNNSGTIYSNTTHGLEITNNATIGGQLINGAGATIESFRGDAIHIGSGSVITGGIVNAGDLRADNIYNIDTAGLRLDGATVNSGGITNNGTIEGGEGAGIGIAVTNGSTVNGNITNNGTIEGGEGSGTGIAVTYGSTVNGNIVNNGTIEGAEGNGSNVATGISITGASQVNGAMINSSGGVIHATYDAILVDASTVTDGIANAGALYGTSGITVQNQSVIGSGGIVNSELGLISTGSNGIAVLSSQVNGGITNAGSINAGTGILVSSGSIITGDILNTGTISASNAIQVYNSTVDGITNLGQINAWQNGIAIDTSIVNGDVRNGSGGVISGSSTGMYLNGSTVNGNVVNDGTINTGGEGYGTGISLRDTAVTGQIVNTGTISTVGNAMEMIGGSADRIVNGSGGLISAAVGSGIYGSSGAVLSNGILNQGQISGARYGIEIHNSAIVSGGIVNDTNAVITGGILTDNTQIGGGITNRGTINGSTFDGGEGYTGRDGIAVTNSTVTGDISNSGTINADGAGIRVDNSTVSGKIVNSGTINGGNSNYNYYYDSQYAGSIVVSNGSVVDSIDNTSTGTITAGNVSSYYGGPVAGISVYNATVNNGISNEGAISGIGGLIVSDSAIGAHGIVNAASGTIQGMEYGIGIGNSQITGDIINHGTIEGAEGIGLYMIGEGNAPSINVSNTVNGSNFSNTVDGSIINDGNITGAYAGAIIEGTAISGTIENGGLIQGTYGGGLSLSGSTVKGITNHVGAVIEGGEGLSLSSSSVSGAITNAGTITGTGGNALSMSYSTADRIVNTATGVISATNGSGIYLDGGEGSSGSVLSNGILNQGQISGTSYGIETHGTTINAGGIVNDTGATITGGVYAGNSQITGDIVNRGTITGAVAQPQGLQPQVQVLGMSIGGSTGTGNGITLANGTTVTGNVINAGTITASNVGIAIDGSTVSRDVTNSGSISGDTGGVALTDGAAIGSIVNTGTIAGGTGSGIAINAATVNGAIENSGTISGVKAIDIVDPVKAVTINNSGKLDGDVSIANGVLNLNGNASRVTGAVDGTGTVNVNGTFTSENTFNVGSFNIANGARFNANNAVTATGGMTNNGTLSVLAVRPFTMTGDYTQTASGVYHIDANSMTSYGQMTVTGTAKLAAKANIDVDVTGVEKLTPNGTLAGVIKAGTLDASTFNVTDNSALFNFEGVINGNNVDLTVRNATTVYSSTQENRNFPGGNAARVLDALFASDNGNSDVSNVQTAFGKLPTTKEVSDAVNQTLPLFTGAAASASSGAVSTTGRIVQARQESNLGLSAGDGFITDRQMWAKPFGSWAKQGDRDGIFGYSASTGGMVVGADGVTGNNDRIGMAFAYANTSVDGNNDATAQSAKVNTYMAMLYGSHSLDQRTDLSWQAEVGTNHVDAGRTINFGGLDRRANSTFHGVNTHLGLSLGRVLAVNETTNFVPSVRLDYTMIKNNGYTETGAGALNLNVEDQRTQSMVLGADGKLTHQLSAKSTFTANLGVGYDLMSKQNSITAAYVGGGAAFSTAGIEPSAWSVRGGAGVILHQSTGMEITARYDADVQRSFTNQTVSVKLRKAF